MYLFIEPFEAPKVQNQISMCFYEITKARDLDSAVVLLKERRKERKVETNKTKTPKIDKQ